MPKVSSRIKNPRGGGKTNRGLESDVPLRAELFNLEQLKRHAEAIAATHQVVSGGGANRLLKRLEKNEKVLRDFNRATLAVNQSRRVTPAADWLLDNFYLIEEQIQMARRHLPPGYSRELPRLATGPFAGWLRVYVLVLELISHVDAQIDLELLAAFVDAYQKVVPLTLGELWAVPIMLRLGLIEDLARVTTGLAKARRQRDLAHEWVLRLHKIAETTPSRLVIVVAEMAKANPPLTSSFVAEFCARLSRLDPALHLARGWLEQRLREEGLSIEQLLHQECQNQAADQVSVSNSIASLRLLSAIDWKEFVETLSLVEHILRCDPADVYADMDFASRDCYRHAVESLARQSGLAETEMAQRAIDFAKKSAADKGRADRMAHVGFYLIDKGQTQLARDTGVRRPWGTILERGICRFSFAFYFGGIVLLSACFTAGFIEHAETGGLYGWKLLLCALTFLVGVSQLAVALMNWLATLLVRPRMLPRLDYSAGIDADQRTMVVVPAILTSLAETDELIETLEIHYLANHDPHLHFALLSDFADAAEEVLPEDEALLDCARTGIERLNRKYSTEKWDSFFLFQRPRRWNESEGVWMGYERKRGKLAEFNAVLRGKAPDRFCEVVGRSNILHAIRYVITLDADTQLPRDAARQLIGTMTHPLHRPEIDPRRGIVTEGYGLMQPRLDITLASAGRSWFARLHAGDAGIDPYTRTVSDVYQDLFDEGSFIGKGIYEVDAFERALRGRFPENTILSHDLLESVYARSALVSDVKVYEAQLADYDVDVRRRKRWMRGDWQILPWLLPRAPSADHQWIFNPISAVSRWKIFDNLRRSLVPVALVLLVLEACLFRALGFLPILLVPAILILPSILSALSDLWRKPNQLPWLMHLRGVGTVIGRALAQIGLTLAFLPYEAFVSLGAIIGTLVRMVVTHRRLLAWTTASELARGARTDLPSFYARMWIAPVVALAAGIPVSLTTGPPLLWCAAPFFIVWLAAPLIAWWISRPIEPAPVHLTSEQLAFLRRAARKTWHFFETFVSDKENWLPPDNFQEDPSPLVASRTSPTNVGFGLLVNLAARDLGYLSLGGLIERTEATIATMKRLERHHGHFYNWYNTRTLQPLFPRYVSSVDSGNLVGYLLTLGTGLRDLPDQKILPAQVFQGLRDTLGMVQRLNGATVALTQLETILGERPSTLPDGHALLQRATAQSAQIVASIRNDQEDLKRWAEILARSCEEHLQELEFLAPWLNRPELRAPQPNNGNQFDGIPTLREISKWDEAISANTRERILKLETLADYCDELARMDFTFLFDKGRDLFSIGFNVTEARRDNSFYDLLASEARLCSFLAVAQGQVAQDHWFSLGRLLVTPRGKPILVSWSGSMFEYLMPSLVMPNYDNTLLDQACKSAVELQIDYGKSLDLPWGMSESGFYRTDAQRNYQYRAFGVPGLGLKRGLGEDLVIAPYASALALMVAPREACENLRRLATQGGEGAYGFYEAIDYTPSRLPPNETKAVVRSYMAHHQGMTLLSLVSLLRDFPMQGRFISRPLLKAADLLLQERMPRTEANVLPEDLELERARPSETEGEGGIRIFANPNSRTPEIHLLSNGSYHIAISHAGGGYSRWHDLAVTRWREDATRDCFGVFLYLRDVATGEFWSTAFQPTLSAVKNYEAIFTQGKAEFRHRRSGLEVHTQVAVSPEEDVELRRVIITNLSSTVRTIEVTSYAEVVLTTQAADEAHPVFSNLFVQTEFLQPSSAILCSRRPRSEEEKPPWLVHVLASHSSDGVSCETDRSRFLGRTETPIRPAAMRTKGPLSNTAGPVLDPIISLRRTITLPPNETASLDFIVGVTGTRENALTVVGKYQHSRMVDRAFDLAWTHSQVTLRQLNASEGDARLYAILAGAIIYADSDRRAASGTLLANRRRQSGLWAHGISGDLPIVLLRIKNTENIEMVRQLVQAHFYWRERGLTVDLIILNEDVSVYRQSLQDAITNLIAAGSEAQLVDKPGGIFVRRVEQLPSEDRVLLEAAARVVLDDENGDLGQQLEHRSVADLTTPALTRTRQPIADVPSEPPVRESIFHNGLGGFTPDGHEYVITLRPGQTTPAPWANVIANPSFGTVITESGGAYTWFENAHEFRLTPWTNDPVEDATGEAFYIRDEDTGQFWSPSPRPARSTSPHVIRHGFGYTVFEHFEHGIVSELLVYVAMDAPVKFAVLKLRNTSGMPRRLSVTGYCEWVLGDLREKTLLNVQTELDLQTGALLARNSFNLEFGDRIAFLDLNEPGRTFTGDRKEFLGRNGDLAQPNAMKRARLSGKTGAGLDPCGAAQVALELSDGEEREITFRLGAGKTLGEVQALIRRFRSTEARRGALAAVHEFWNRTLGAINVDTPDPAVNTMANGWLLYQTLSCRYWGRTGFYQSGGAYGFRDQLQDVMALVHTEPAFTREHLLRAATHQFIEGDVQHWWHPPGGRGVRTHCSDDYLWLPYVVCRYVSTTADTGVLDEQIPFLEARPVMPEEESYYDLPSRSQQTATLYEHCVRSIENGLKFGEHGLPLIGSGDWNDGLNKIGREGRGESVWLAFFLYDVLTQFAKLAQNRNDTAFAERCLIQARTLQKNTERNAWDGEWYRRAYFDNGEPLGSRSNEECQFDSIPQSWSVISRAGDPERSRQAMNALDQRLVLRDAKLIELLTPPFDKSALNPGYIKGYIPGVRENGGQYTHAAVWAAMAFALMGETERAWELFNLLNPIHHGATSDEIGVYKVEPYVIAADVYSRSPHTGRGGWSWYTGSASWTYRLLTETLLGVNLEGDRLRLLPRMPKAWSSYKIHYRYRQTVYHITISRNPEISAAQPIVSLDGHDLSETAIPLVDDHVEHFVQMQIS
jgi:cyclic beta-1,2-glucan synthetase